MASGHRDDGKLRPNLADHMGRKVGRERYSASGSYYGREESYSFGTPHEVEREEMVEMMSEHPYA